MSTISEEDAERRQRELAAALRLEPLAGPVLLAAGADVAYDQHSPRVFAAVVLLRLPDCELLETAEAEAEAAFPYVPGLLSFREAPPLIEAFGKLSVRPDVLVCDGNGVAHPRRFGLACHVGVELGVPAVGCAKSRHVGEYVEPDDVTGASSPLTDGGETVGSALRTRAGVKPVFVSAGHLITLPEAERVVLACCRGYRLPETTRLADQSANAALRRSSGA